MCFRRDQGGGRQDDATSYLQAMQPLFLILPRVPEASVHPPLRPREVHMPALSADFLLAQYSPQASVRSPPHFTSIRHAAESREAGYAACASASSTTPRSSPSTWPRTSTKRTPQIRPQPCQVPTVSRTCQSPKHLALTFLAVAEAAPDWSSIPTPKSCGVCKIPLGTASDFQAHLSSQPACRTRQLDCHLCPKSFIWPVTMQKHLTQHSDEAEREWFFCDVCRKALVSSKAVFLHKKKFHPELFPKDQNEFATGEHSYTESFSESAFGPDTPPLKKRGRKPGSRVCTPCKKTFTTQRDFILHQSQFHGGAAISSLDLDEPMSEPSSASPFVLSHEDEEETQPEEILIQASPMEDEVSSFLETHLVESQLDESSQSCLD
ncbi:hypothetical protein LAZ67_1001202 [Cordylochernes scorpioides]|uniref:C2H2-type domain-containing protein n=1 Tax=Cordylochernes scorpioides TaxID=51811 RepID=A0ABY6JWA1_9ARAC|nr:hypothetical protein LAZ67_1001202 [Cordylochernes scorpioides]